LSVAFVYLSTSQAFARKNAGIDKKITNKKKKGKAKARDDGSVNVVDRPYHAVLKRIVLGH
jgi:hypothetical protein